jgi:hypothetical protein
LARHYAYSDYDPTLLDGRHPPPVGICWVVSADGGEWHVVDVDRSRAGGLRPLVWARDGGALYLTRPWSADDPHRAPEVMVWNAAEARSAIATLPRRGRPNQMVALPNGSALILGHEHVREITPEGDVRLPPRDLGRTLVKDTWVGLDGQGRMVLQRRDERGAGSTIVAVDPETGAVTEIYP